MLWLQSYNKTLWKLKSLTKIIKRSSSAVNIIFTYIPVNIIFAYIHSFAKDKARMNS